MGAELLEIHPTIVFFVLLYIVCKTAYNSYCFKDLLLSLFILFGHKKDCYCLPRIATGSPVDFQRIEVRAPVVERYTYGACCRMGHSLIRIM